METSTQAAEHGERRAIGPLVAWSVLALAQVAIGFIGMQASDDGVDDNPLFTWEFTIGSLVAYGFILLLTVGIVAGYSLDFRRSLGFRRFEPRWLGIGAGVIVAAFVVGALMNLVGDATEEQGLAPERWESGKTAAFVAAAAVVVLVAPFAEEVFFRGLGVRVLAFAGPLVAIGIPAVAFALAHGLLIGLPTLVVLGGGLAWIRYHSGSVWPCFLTHAAWNGIALAVAAATSF